MVQNVDAIVQVYFLPEFRRLHNEVYIPSLLQIITNKNPISYPISSIKTKNKDGIKFPIYTNSKENTVNF